MKIGKWYSFKYIKYYGKNSNFEYIGRYEGYWGINEGINEVMAKHHFKPIFEFHIRLGSVGLYTAGLASFDEFLDGVIEVNEEFIREKCGETFVKYEEWLIEQIL